MRTEKDWIKRAYAQMNRKFINIGSYVGHGTSNMDFDGSEFFFDLEINEEILGEALLSAIINSRFITLKEEDVIWANNVSDYNNWIKRVMKAHDFKHKGEMFKPMLYCSIKKTENGYVFCTTHQRAMNSWSAGDKNEEFTIPLTATAAEMGAALRRCLALCTSKFDPPKGA